MLTESSKQESIMDTKTVLVVEDNVLNMKLFRTLLQVGNYQVLCAENAETGIRMATELIPDLILMDVQLPDMDGLTATRQLKSDPTTRKIPVVALTAYAMEKDKKMAIEAGCSDHMAKPIDTKKFLSMVSQYISGERKKIHQPEPMGRPNILVVDDDPMNVKPLDTLLKREGFYTCSTSNGSDARAHSASILLVEDNPKDVNLFKLYLKNQPYRLILSETGEKAIALCQNEVVDLVLLDLMLPGLDGFDVCRRLRENDKTKTIQILMVSCRNDLESKLKGIDLGADEFLIKPVNREELVVRIRSLIKKKRYMDRLVNRFETTLCSSITDDLTELYNCSYLKHFMELEIKRCDRQHQPMSFIMIDIDDFKQYNDTYGHPAGDILLKQFGRLIKKTVRDIDLAARYGGEEFGIVLPYTNREEALSVAEGVLNSLRNCSLSEEPSRLCERKTASMGIACYPDNGVSVAEIIQHADDALYRAKRQGKNQICVC